eukprot:5361064-Prymnesium_polylepis.1
MRRGQRAARRPPAPSRRTSEQWRWLLTGQSRRFVRRRVAVGKGDAYHVVEGTALGRRTCTRRIPR